MLEFTLAVDYQGCTTASMSVADHEHFMYINKAMRELRSTLVLRPEDKTSCKQVIPNPEERQVLAAYFWKYLFEPCKALSLPLDFVYESIRALNLYTDSRGRYKGSVFGLLQQFGVESLAAKLYRDRHVLIPLILPATPPAIACYTDSAPFKKCTSTASTEWKARLYHIPVCGASRRSRASNTKPTSVE
jgi:hypothetical protein